MNFIFLSRDWTFSLFFARIDDMSIKKRRITLLICVIIFLIAAPVAAMYSSGYRFSPISGFYKTGGIYVSSPLSGSRIFVNNKEEAKTGLLEEGVLLQNLKPGKYSVLAAKEGYWPWQKKLFVREQAVTEARALLVTKEPVGKLLFSAEEITQGKIWQNQQYSKIYKDLLTLEKISMEKSTTTEKISSNGKQTLSINEERTTLSARWNDYSQNSPYFFCSDDDEKDCPKETIVLQSKFPVKGADFYPGRDDAMIISVESGVYAIEIDGRGGRMLQPVYKGRNPVSIMYSGDPLIYILDENSLFQLSLD
ncbi:hypothetical protein C4572_01480 [Candidatus Parcubacteria bacterium]|nr:MAG: hypothetical protein C4572_01480 [Candidatus Parcubacteria bacterium]